MSKAHLGCARIWASAGLHQSAYSAHTTRTWYPAPWSVSADFSILGVLAMDPAVTTQTLLEDMATPPDPRRALVTTQRGMPKRYSREVAPQGRTGCRPRP